MDKLTAEAMHKVHDLLKLHEVRIAQCFNQLLNNYSIVINISPSSFERIDFKILDYKLKWIVYDYRKVLLSIRYYKDNDEVTEIKYNPLAPKQPPKRNLSTGIKNPHKEPEKINLDESGIVSEQTVKEWADKHKELKPRIVNLLQLALAIPTYYYLHFAFSACLESLVNDEFKFIHSQFVILSMAIAAIYLQFKCLMVIINFLSIFFRKGPILFKAGGKGEECKKK